MLNRPIQMKVTVERSEVLTVVDTGSEAMDEQQGGFLLALSRVDVIDSVSPPDPLLVALRVPRESLERAGLHRRG